MNVFLLTIVIGVVTVVSADSSTIVLQPSSSSSSVANEASPTSSTPSIQGSTQTNQESSVNVSPEPTSTVIPQQSSSSASPGYDNNDIRKMTIQFTITNQNYTSKLNDSSSTEFQGKADNIKSIFDDIFKNDTDYIKTVVHSFQANEENFLGVNVSIWFPSTLTVNDITENKMDWSMGDPSSQVFSLGSYTINKASLKTSIEADGQWGNWINFGDCDETTSKQTQQRTCNPGGKPCQGNNTREVDCTPQNESDSSGVTQFASSSILCVMMALLAKQISRLL